MASKAIEFGQRQRLTVQLKGLVRKYPRGVGIFKEFLQNADDAGADFVRMTLDLRRFPGNHLPSPDYGDLLGPSLVVINNRPFTEEDWFRIQEVNDSGKILDVTKTGRFGLGFNSVYNITDYPMLLAAGKVAIFDPHERFVTDGVRRTGIAWDINDLANEVPELFAVFDGYGDDLAVSNFGYSIFRLPLRTKSMAARSEICQEPFTKDDLQEIVDGIRRQSCGLLLFLNSVLSYEICKIDPDGRKHDLLAVETLNPHNILAERSKIRSLMGGSNEAVLAQLALLGGCETTYEHRIQVRSAGAVEKMDWFVSRGIYDSEDLIASAREMVEINEKAVPIAGAAVRWDVPVDEGLLSCALPLPMRSGIPLHVDGFFDLEDSRQDLHQDYTATSQNSRVRVSWNNTLLRDGCARAAASLIEFAGQRTGEPNYANWPTIVAHPHRIVDKLPAWIYRELTNRPCIAAGLAQEFVPVERALQTPWQLRESLLADGLLVPNPDIPPHVLEGFNAVDNPVPELQPSALRQILRSTQAIPCQQLLCTRPSLRCRDDLIELLKYCLSDEDFEDFDGVPLALMGDGMLMAFNESDTVPIYIGNAVERRLLEPLPGIYLDPEIQELNIEKLPNVFSMQLEDLILQFYKMFSPLTRSNAGPAIADLPVPDDEWLIDFFGYCVSEGKRLRISRMPRLEILRTFPVVPDGEGHLWGMGDQYTPVFEKAENRNWWKEVLLREAGVEFAAGVGKLGGAITRFKSHFAEDEIPSFNSEYMASFLVSNFQQISGILDSDPSLALHIIGYLAHSGASGLTVHQAGQLASLPLFTKVGGGLTAIVGMDVYLSSNFTPPNAAFDVAILSVSDERHATFLKSLGAQVLTEVQYIQDFVLPKFSDLSNTEQFETLQWLRRTYYTILDSLDHDDSSKLQEALATSPIVRCSDGFLRSPRQVYHPECDDAARLLGALAYHPDRALFGDAGWLEMLVTWGMPRSVRAVDVLRVIDQLISTPLTSAISHKLKQVSDAIDRHWESLNSQDCDGQTFAHQLATRAWLPAITQCPSDFTDTLFKVPTKELHLPGQLVHKHLADLACSIQPVCRFPIGSNLQNAISMYALLIADVLRQFDNAIDDAQAFGATECHNRIFHAVYRSIGGALTRSENKYDGSGLIGKYAHRQCILDGNEQLWRPCDCFKADVPYFIGMRQQVTSRNQNEDAFLAAIGRKSTPDVSDFHRFFVELPARCANAPLTDKQLDKLRGSYRRAAKLGSPNDFSNCPVLTVNGTFAPSSEVLIDDAPWLSKRAQESGIELLDCELGAMVAMAFGVGQLSLVVREQVESWSRSGSAELNDTCDRINALIHSTEFAKAIYRLVEPHCRDGGIVEKLRPFQVRAAGKIRTSLLWENEPIAISTGEATMVLDGDSLYVDVMREAVLRRHVSTTIAKQILSNYQFIDVSAIDVLLGEHPDQLESLLNDLRVPNLPDDIAFEPVVESDPVQESSKDVEPPAESPAPQTGTVTSTPNGHVSKPQLIQRQMNDVQQASDQSNRVPHLPTPRPGSKSIISSATVAQRSHRAVTYVGCKDATPNTSNGSNDHTNRVNVDAAAIQAVRDYEIECGRVPAVMEHFNEGYDVESRDDQGVRVVRYIEVKGLSGAWNEFGVKLSIAQVQFAVRKEAIHWVYVVEFALDPVRRVIHAFRNPLAKATDFRLDGGWKGLSDEMRNATQAAIRVGTQISYDGLGEGEIIRIQEFGAFKKLEIRFTSGQTLKIRFPDPKIQHIHS